MRSRSSSPIPSARLCAVGADFGHSRRYWQSCGRGWCGCRGPARAADGTGQRHDRRSGVGGLVGTADLLGPALSSAVVLAIAQVFAMAGLHFLSVTQI